MNFNRPISLNIDYIKGVTGKRQLNEMTNEQKAQLNLLLATAFSVEYKSQSQEFLTELTGFEVTEFTDFKNLEFKLLFENPLYVSFLAEGSSSSDILRVSLLHPEVFVDPATNLPILPGKNPFKP